MALCGACLDEGSLPAGGCSDAGLARFACHALLHPFVGFGDVVFQNFEKFHFPSLFRGLRLCFDGLFKILEIFILSDLFVSCLIC